MKITNVLLLIIVLFTALLACTIQERKPAKEPITQEEFYSKWNGKPAPKEGFVPDIKFDTYEEADAFFQQIFANSEPAIDTEAESPDDLKTKRDPLETTLGIHCRPLYYIQTGYIHSESWPVDTKIYRGAENIQSYLLGPVIFQNYKQLDATWKVSNDGKVLTVTAKGLYEIGTQIGDVGSVEQTEVTRSLIFDQADAPHYTKAYFKDIFPETPTDPPKTSRTKPKKKAGKKKQNMASIPAYHQPTKRPIKTPRPRKTKAPKRKVKKKKLNKNTYRLKKKKKKK